MNNDRQGIKVARWMEEKLRIRNHVVEYVLCGYHNCKSEIR
jgi:hypothetical protein